MQITLSPIASNKTTRVSVSGLVITIDGLDYDLSEIPDGGQADPTDESPFIGKLTRTSCTILYEYDSSIAEPRQSQELDTYIFNVEDSEVPCPIQWK